MAAGKIVGVGLNKTGTSTFGTCMRRWGLWHKSCCGRAFRLWTGGQQSRLLKIIERFDSFEDWPWALCYGLIDENYPGSKFVLTKRANADVWFDSLQRHAEQTGPTIFREVIYGHSMPTEENKSHHVEIYERHMKEVREYFKDRSDDLLEVCWEDGDGWKKLGEFLGLLVPDIPFPHTNRGKTWEELRCRR